MIEIDTKLAARTMLSAGLNPQEPGELDSFIRAFEQNKNARGDPYANAVQAVYQQRAAAAEQEKLSALGVKDASAYLTAAFRPLPAEPQPKEIDVRTNTSPTDLLSAGLGLVRYKAAPKGGQ